MSSVNKKSVVRMQRNWVPVFVLIGSIALCATSASSDDRQILDQLYQEIIGSSNDDGITVTGKSTSVVNGLAQPEVKENTKSGTIHPDIDPAAEKLRQEIQKIVDEANIRHEDAVKFMQDTK